MNNPANLLVVDAVDNGRYRHDVYAVRIQVLDGAHLDVEQVAYGTMGVRRVADAIELEVSVAQPGISGLLAKIGILREFNAVGGRLHAGVADLAAVTHRIQEVR